MKERPILFSGPMVSALLAGTKTMTRRLVRDQDNGGVPGGPVTSFPTGGLMHWIANDQAVREDWAKHLRCPYGVPGDRLWVRETWHPCDGGPDLFAADYDDGEEGKRAAGVERWFPSIHQPRVSSRIDLEITAVRVERLQSIAAADVKAEGIAVPDVDYSVADDPRNLDDEREAWARGHFATLWDTINGDRAAWASNPWVWAVSFRRVRP